MKYLDTSNRTEELNKHILENFSKLSSIELDINLWQVNGTSDLHWDFQDYTVLSTSYWVVKESSVLIKYVQENSDIKSKIVIFDLGAGLGENCKNFANILSQIEFNKNCEIHLYSLTGETLAGGNKEYNIKENIFLHEFGQVNLHNIKDFCTKHQVTEIDFAVSRYALRHCEDGLGIFKDVHDLLTTGGLIISDTFDINVINDESTFGKALSLSNNTGANRYKLMQMLRLTNWLHESGDEILISISGAQLLGSHDKPSIMVQKHIDQELIIPLSYFSMSEHVHDNYSRAVAVYKNEQENEHYTTNIEQKIKTLLEESPNGKFLSNCRKFIGEEIDPNFRLVGDQALSKWLTSDIIYPTCNYSDPLEIYPIEWQSSELIGKIDELIDIINKF